ncbi:hypothetical protein LAZ67_15001328 [Cordylochernes scorpioides]|uniref:Peptidase A2B Ty3 transposon peptidase domain-containing protein n=1 Tax=Cordylochernes scorpioides TaxID=51811 RepID=A0ABY6L8N7_9ARAC|nr:hypothetical protein LAZ67_15001328 [Cordylochernes scorpioides]
MALKGRRFDTRVHHSGFEKGSKMVLQERMVLHEGSEMVLHDAIAGVLLPLTNKVGGQVIFQEFTTLIQTLPLLVTPPDEKGGGGAVTSSLKNLGSAGPADSTLYNPSYDQTDDDNRTTMAFRDWTTNPALERALVTIAHQDNALQQLNKLTSPLQSHQYVPYFSYRCHNVLMSIHTKFKTTTASRTRAGPVTLRRGTWENIQCFQHKLSTVKIENKETLLQLLKNIRPSLEKKPFEPKPYQTTGSSINLMRRDLLVKYKWKSYPSETTITTIDKSHVQATENIEVELQVDDQQIMMTATILREIPFELLIGKPTMRDLGIQWNFGTDEIKCLSLRSKEVIFTSDDLITIFPKLCNVSKKELPLHEIDFLLKPNNNNVACKPYPLTDHKRAWTAGKTKEMLDEGIITPSTSEYASPCF